MVLVFGTRHKRHPIGFFKAPCHVCGAVTDHLRVWDKGVAHVWFIPLFPIKSKRLIICGGCGTSKPDRPELDAVPIGGIVGLPSQGLKLVFEQGGGGRGGFTGGLDARY